MNLENVEKLIKLAKDSGVKELKYETSDLKISVELPFSEAAVAQPSYVMPAQTMTSEVKTGSKASSESGLVDVTSPFVGTFYRASSPGAEPYAKKGQKISKGDVVCIVEAMKIMNEIESEVSGEIVEVCVENENYVEFGQVLFKVRP